MFVWTIVVTTERLKLKTLFFVSNVIAVIETRFPEFFRTVFAASVQALAVVTDYLHNR